MDAGFIQGAFVAGQGAILRVDNPSDESEVASFPGLSEAQVGEAIRSAREAFDDGRWSDLPAIERAAVLRRMGQALRGMAAEITDMIVAEAGCPRATSSIHSQVAMPMGQIDEIIDLFLSLPQTEDNPIPLAQRVTPLGGTIQSIRRYQPIGVVSAIAAYNFPFLTALWKVFPALVTGNTVVLRPSPFTPISATFFARAAQEAGLPAGVLNVVIEGGLEGARLMTTDRRVDMIAFTGSTRVGVEVMQQAASTMKRLQLELGGKSAQIFLPDALDRVVPHVVGALTSHAGQGCAIGTRIFVPEEAKAEIAAKLKAACEAVKIGPAEGADTRLGPVISAAQRDRCAHFVKLAVEGGGNVVTGGERPADLPQGFFFQPTVLDVPDNGNPAAQEEIFGPVVTLIGYRDVDHAVAMANDSRYGLSGYVHGVDKKAAFAVGRRIRSGTVNVNGGMMSSYVSSGGQRMSGLGRERGPEGLRLYQDMSVLNLGG